MESRYVENRAITYTNRMGRTYYLCVGKTKSGKPRYHFAREPSGEPVSAIPEGLGIEESINGVVSLAKARPLLISKEETDVIRTAVAAHPKGNQYRVEAKADAIMIYEREGIDPLGLAAGFIERLGGWGVDLAAARRLRDDKSDHFRYDPVMRFILAEGSLMKGKRWFLAQRMTYRGDGGWRTVEIGKFLGKLAADLVPKLGTDAFFELM